MAKDGIITRKDIIEENAINWGEEYMSKVQKAIDKNKEFKKGILEMVSVMNQIKDAPNNSAFIKAKEKSIELTKRQQIVWKEQIQLENQLLSIKKKKELATESTNRSLIKERVALNETTKALKEEAREQHGLITAYKKLDKARSEAQSRLQDLIVRGKKAGQTQKQYNSELRIAQKEFDVLNKKILSADKAVGKFNRNVGNYPLKAMSSISHFVGAFGVVGGIELFTHSIKEAFNTVVDFDRQLIAVGKTTGIRGEKLKEFGDSVVKLGGELKGISIEGLLEASEVAGQLGIEGSANILKFAKTTKELALTSDFASKEVVQGFAKFIEVSSDTVENADRLGSVITDLGNHFASTESQVLSNALEIQKGISVYNTTADSVLALGAATNALGSEAEASRSAIQSTFAVLNKAMSTGKNLEKILKLTGYTQKELSDQFKKDGTVVFKRFVEGLHKVGKAGANLSNELNELGITEKRAFTVIGSLAKNYDTLEKAMYRANAEYINNKALSIEVATSSQSISSILGDIKDKWHEYIISVNRANDGTKTITTILKYLRDNLIKTLNTVVKLTGIFLVYKGIIIASSAVTTAYTAVTTTLRIAKIALTKGIAAARAEMVLLNATMSASPYGVVLALVGSLAAAYFVFTDSISDATRALRRLSIETEDLKNTEDDYNSKSEKSRQRRFEMIKKEINIRRNKNESEKKLDTEELERKKEVVQADIYQYDLLKKAEIERTETHIKESEQRIKQMELEKNAGKTTGRRRDHLIISIETETTNLKSLKNNLTVNSRITISEKKKLLKILSDLEEEYQIKIASNKKEQIEEKKKKDIDLLKKQKEAENDAYALAQIRLKTQADLSKDFYNNEKNNIQERLDAIGESAEYEKKIADSTLEHKLKNISWYDESVRKLTKEEINTLVDGESIQKGLNDKEKIAIIEHQNELRAINERYKKERGNLIDFDISKFKKELDEKVTEKEKALNKELIAENEFYKNNDESNKNAEQKEKEHQERIAAIKKKYLDQALNDQIKHTQNILDCTDLSGTQREEVDRKLYALKLALSNSDVENYKDAAQKKLDAEREYSERVKELSFELFHSVNGFANALFESKISNIDFEIQQIEGSYQKQIEAAGDDARKKEALQKESEKKREELEKKKRQEQYKQAVYNKATAIMEIGVNTALAISKVSYNPFFIALVSAIGAAQLATVIASPIPKYKHGRQGGKAEFAEVGDGYIHEVIQKKDGSTYITPNKPTLTYLEQGDNVFSSVEDYYNLQRNILFNELHKESKMLKDFQAKQNIDNAYNRELLEELRRNTKAVEKNRSNIVIKTPNIDIEHAIWAAKNRSW